MKIKGIDKEFCVFQFDLYTLHFCFWITFVNSLLQSMRNYLLRRWKQVEDIQDPGGQEDHLRVGGREGMRMGRIDEERMEGEMEGEMMRGSVGRMTERTDLNLGINTGGTTLIQRETHPVEASGGLEKEILMTACVQNSKDPVMKMGVGVIEMMGIDHAHLMIRGHRHGNGVGMMTYQVGGRQGLRNLGMMMIPHLTQDHHHHHPPG